MGRPSFFHPLRCASKSFADTSRLWGAAPLEPLSRADSLAIGRPLCQGGSGRYPLTIQPLRPRENPVPCHEASAHCER